MMLDKPRAPTVLTASAKYIRRPAWIRKNHVLNEHIRFDRASYPQPLAIIRRTGIVRFAGCRPNEAFRKYQDFLVSPNSLLDWREKHGTSHRRVCQNTIRAARGYIEHPRLEG